MHLRLGRIFYCRAQRVDTWLSSINEPDGSRKLMITKLFSI